MTEHTQCVYCGRPLSEGEMTTDHVVPLSRGGSDRQTNKAPACRTCNWDKAQLTADEYLRMRDQPEEMEAYKRQLHGEMSARGKAAHRALHVPLPSPPPTPPPNHHPVDTWDRDVKRPQRTYAQADTERRENSRKARKMRSAGECIKGLGFDCYCQVCDPDNTHATRPSPRLTQNLKDLAALRFKEEVTDREIRG